MYAVGEKCLAVDVLRLPGWLGRLKVDSATRLQSEKGSVGGRTVRQNFIVDVKMIA